MKEAEAAAHRLATHHRACLTFSTIADGRKYIAIHEDATDLIRPTAEIAKGFDQVVTVAQNAKATAWTRQHLDSVHFFERMENAAWIISEQLQQADVTAQLHLPEASTSPHGVDLHLLKAMQSTNTWPPGDAVRIARAAANGDLAELVLRVDTILTKGREAAVRRSVVAVWQTEIPDQAATWFCDATADVDELQAILGRPVSDKTPLGDLEHRHPAVQVTIDIKKSTVPSTVVKVLRGILAAFPDAKRIGVITHQEHLPIIRGTAQNPDHRLEELLRRRIAKLEHFHSGEGRGSNSWIDQCDLLLVLGTPRVPPHAVKLRLIQVGLVLAAARDGQWEADWWSGTTTTGKQVTIRTSAYRDHDWYAAHRSIVRAELIQAIGRGRGICEKGIPVVVLSNEPLGLPILEIDVHPLSDTAVKVLQAIRQLSEQNPKGESLSGQQSSYRNKTLNDITLEFCSVSSSERVAVVLGLTDRRIRYVLDDLAGRGFVQRIGQRGGWVLTPKGKSFIFTSPTTEPVAAAAAETAP